MRALLTGDIHIGRSSSRVADDVARSELRAAEAWHRAVELAVRERVDVVCLSGDVADQDNRFWEAIGPLEQGIGRLAEAGIRTVAVSGNHDYDVLARLADQLPAEHFTLLGRGGRWERVTIGGNGNQRLHIDGWSFPRERVHGSPLNDYDLERDDALPILGLVHGDLDAGDSPYAPLDLARLRALPPAGWLLGHIHAPRLIDGSPWVLYPGSPQAFDPGEPGRHGPWIADVVGGRLDPPQPRALSSVWYDRHTIDVSGADDEAGLEGLLLHEVQAQRDRIAGASGPHLIHASVRLRLVGSTRASHLVAGVAERVRADLRLPVGSGSLVIERIDVLTLPAVDLAEYAHTQSAPGALARLLLELDRPDVSPEAANLIRQARHDLEQVDRQRDFAQLEPRTFTDQDVREHLRRQGRALITQLVSQSG